MNIRSKKGVSIISLVLIIVILLIITSTVVITLSALARNSKRVAFAKDLTTIRDKCIEYYSVYGDLPISTVEGAKRYTSNQFVNAVNTQIGANASNILSSEIVANNDTTEIFYQIDLQKLDVKSTARGVSTSDEYDVYLITDNTHNIYYLKGYKVSDDRYFSIVNIESE